MLLLLLPYLLFLGSLRLILAYEDPRVTLCGIDTTYTSNSTFSTNLSLALTTLRNSTAATGFNATTIATKNMTDPVTALALCRANLSSSDCQTCVNAATSGILQACPNQIVAQVWYTLCMVRYSSVNFISKPDYSIGFMLYNVRDAPDQNDYDPKVRMLMQNLSYAAGLSDQRSAVGMTHMVGNRTIYGYVDCTRDVNSQDCTTCLLGATDSIPSCCWANGLVGLLLLLVTYSLTWTRFMMIGSIHQKLTQMCQPPRRR
ncbi:Cysteine-rich repeat secretory protein 38 [Camellia lanceoleosa]|uniref:Cysteine-rich repeat secretory protein 38 n=1 Tax=Camellia lanceoleosa TaxID=1840588 RepID=A0ACC0J282_9ERIC|nr:Cysteine-rich repeat secretory protein 38 [Camellia lanceoleosa]